MRVVAALSALALMMGVFALLVGTSTPILAWCGTGAGACGLVVVARVMC